MVKIKCHQYNAAIKIAANVNTFLCIVRSVSDEQRSAFIRQSPFLLCRSKWTTQKGRDAAHNIKIDKNTRARAEREFASRCECDSQRSDDG